MTYFRLFLVFFIGLVLQVSMASGAQVEDGKQATDVEQEEALPLSQPAAKATAQPSNSSDSSQANIQPSKSHTSASSQPSIQNTNNIQLTTPPLAYSSADRDKYDEPASVLGTHERLAPRQKWVGIIPMVGGSGYFTDWSNHINNKYSFGLALDFMVSPVVSLEVEGGYGKYRIAYSQLNMPFQHDFNQYQIGGNAKFYITRTVVEPYLGGGIMALYYENMSHGPIAGGYGMGDRYNTTVGAGQLFAGMDVPLTSTIALGGRFAWVTPLFNRPVTSSNAYRDQPGYDEAAAMNTNLWRLMGSVKISL